MNGKDRLLEDMKRKLSAIREYDYSKHFTEDVIEERKTSEAEVKEALRTFGELLFVEQQEENKYRLVFPSGKRYYLTIVIRFIDTYRLKIITAFPMSAKRFRRYQKWLLKTRR